MSEGINFGDGLARLVVMIGLPFPNPNDPVLTEKIKYMTEHATTKMR
jgi:chromosome transmission fidelity protein 1